MTDTLTREQLQEELVKAATSGNLERIVQLQRMAATFVKDEAEVRIKAQSAERDAFKALVEEELQALDAPEGYQVVGQVMLGIDGKWSPTNCRIEQVGTTPQDAIMEALKETLATAPSSVKAFNVCITAAETTMSYPTYTAKTGKGSTTPKSEGTKRGYGWQKNGETVALGDAFGAVASQAEKDTVAAIKAEPKDAPNKGNRLYQIQTKAVKAAGYVKA